MKDRDPAATQDAWARFGWIMGAIWLVFLVYPAFALLRSEAEPWARAVGWCGLTAFAVAYLAGFVTGMRVKPGSESVTTKLLFWGALCSALLTLPAIGWAATAFTPFLMSYTSYLLSRRWHWTVNALGPVLIVTEIAILGAGSGAQPWGLLWIVLMVAAVNTVNSWLIRRSVRADELRFELATSEERESVARDVHDLLGHSLTVVKLKAELASRLIDTNPEAARAEIDAIVQLASEAIAGVRSTVTGLRAEGLTEQLQASTAAFGSAGISVEIRGTATALSPAQSVPAAWILREATTNVLRHSGARSVVISLDAGTLTVEDDGTGLDQATPTGDGARPAGHGLRGMAERAAAAGAELRVDPGAGRGTRVSLTW